VIGAKDVSWNEYLLLQSFHNKQDVINSLRKNDEVISLADSSVLRWIDELNGFTDIDQSVNNIRNAIKFI
jgi:hypothetical protein